MAAMNLCMPALVYLVFSAIAVVGAVMSRATAMTVIMKVLFVGIWTWFLNFLCMKGYETISWVLVLMPFILLGLMLLIGLEIVAKSAPAPADRAHAAQKH